MAGEEANAAPSSAEPASQIACTYQVATSVLGAAEQVCAVATQQWTASLSTMPMRGGSRSYAPHSPQGGLLVVKLASEP